MGPLRLLLILLALAVGIRLLATLARRLPFLPTAARDPAGAPARLSRCAHCGEYAPETEGIRAGPEVYYCCREHAAADRGPPRP